jgi:hypothetical protein
MITSQIVCPIVAFLVFCAQHGKSFPVIRSTSHVSSVRFSSSRPTSVEDVASEQLPADILVDSEEQTKSELKFVGKIKQVSSPLSYTSKDDVVAFFTCPKYRNMFITAGGKRECSLTPMTPEILQEWTRISLRDGGMIPDLEDEVFTVKTGGVQFPGLTLETSATMGIKLMMEDYGPKYEVVLIKDERKVTGLPPVVYLFNRLTGGDNENGSSSTASTTYITCDFSQQDSKVIFTTDTILSVTVSFPSFLLKLLPMNKAKAEEKGSLAITQTVEKDVAASMVAYEEEYRKAFF